MLLSKHHGLGNDFLVALDERNDGGITITPELAVRACDRRRGIGADGLIHGAAPTPDQAAAGIDVVMHLLNSDGSRAEMSGNGVRCLGQAVAFARGITEGTITVLTDAGLRPLEVSPLADPDASVVSVAMGRAATGLRVPGPVAEYLPHRFGTVDVGNPHLVILVDDPDMIDLATEGAWLEQQFPGGVNVEFVAPGDRPGTVHLRVWERGAGITEACGTGACASAFLFKSWFSLPDDEAVEVRMPGGDVQVLFGPDDELTLVGPAVFIADIELVGHVELVGAPEPVEV